MSYTCYQHGWSDEHLPCPQCQPIVLSSATTDASNMRHTKHTTGEQPGMDKYSEGFIYMNYRTSGISHSFDKKVYVIGPHSFRDGEDVTGRYELVYQTNFGTSWDEAPKIVYDACIESGRRIVAIPLPSKGQEGEAERKALTIQDVIQAYTDGYSNGNIDTGLSGHEYVLNKYGTTPATTL